MSASCWRTTEAASLCWFLQLEKGGGTVAKRFPHCVSSAVRTAQRRYCNIYLRRQKKTTATWDRQGHVPQGFDVVRLQQISKSVWCNAYMMRLQQVLQVRGHDMSSAAVCQSISTADFAERLLSEASQGSIVSGSEGVLFHGTKPSSIAGILSRGFDPALCDFGLAGRGFYFAESITKADEYTECGNDGLCCVLVCRVLLGKIKACAEQRLTVTQRQALEDTCTSKEYDSVMLDRERCRGTYREFVVYDTARCLPLCVVWYERRSGAHP
mmetsp:Transcript_93997/g.215048  ORF Transcript_93997/g.215048 Transcript_93997/m.215048 type:complete len:269 (-) Transcript_93997:86-892(-)